MVATARAGAAGCGVRPVGQAAMQASMLLITKHEQERRSGEGRHSANDISQTMLACEPYSPLVFTELRFTSPKNIVLPKSDDETIGAQRGSTPWLTPGRREAGALLPACAWVVMDAALFNKPQGSGSRAPRKTPNGGGSKQPAPTAATSPNSRAARGSSSCERGAGTAESHLEERGPQPSMVPRQQLEATVSTPRCRSRTHGL